MKRISIIVLTFFMGLAVSAQRTESVVSPDGQIKVSVTVSDRIYYSVTSHGETLLKDSRLSMTLRDRTLGEEPKLRSSKVVSVSNTVNPLFAFKFSTVEDNYSLLTLTFAGGYKIEWRVYDDGVAYRFITDIKGDIEVMSEEATLALTSDSELVLQQPGGFKTSHEEKYTKAKSGSWKADDKMSELPIVITAGSHKMLFTEYDLFDYPGMFIHGNADNTLSSIHPKTPLEYEDKGDRSQNILKEADYIAKTTGRRSFPWRYMLITQDDRHLAENVMPMRLAPKNSIGDTSWVKPGLTCWDWLNGIPYGQDVDFRAGINYETIAYFIDFAAEYGIRYMLMDEGWALSTRNPFETNPKVDLPKLIRYGESKGVGIILWLPWLTVEHNMNLFEVFEQWGIKGVKIDFMDRQDQWMVNFYERVAKEAAKHHIMVDFHGAYHPSGMEYKYPNVLTFEGVRGLEMNGSCTPENTVYLPFIRNSVGPMDFTPGAMIAYQPKAHKGGRPICTVVGTKCYSLAHFVLFETNLQMLADNPVRYRQWPDCTKFITGVPVNWDETKVLFGELGEYIIVAKRNGKKWWIGGITNGTPRECEVSLDFLDQDRTYKMTAFQDGINADLIAMDYKRIEKTVSSRDKYTVKMVMNGGFAAIIE